MATKSILTLGGDGTAVPAGYVGEVIETVITSTVLLSNTLGTFTDIASVVLTAGTWEVETAGNLYCDVGIASGVGAAGNIAITNSSNTILRALKGNVVKGGEFQYSLITVKTRINTTGGTFKSRGTFTLERGSPTVSNAQLLADSTYVAYIRAVRVGN